MLTSGSEPDGYGLFTCVICHEEYRKERSDDVAWREFDSRFPGEPHENCTLICHDCFMQLEYYKQHAVVDDDIEMPEA